MSFSLDCSLEQEFGIASQDGYRVPQFMCDQADKFILEALGLCEGGNILVDHQRGAGPCFCGSAREVFLEQGQPAQIHRHRVGEHGQRGAIGMTNVLLVRLPGFTPAECAHHHKLLNG